MMRDLFSRARAVAIARAAPAPTNAVAVAEIQAGRQRVESRVESLQSLTEQKVLACGGVLSSIVENVRRLISDTRGSVAATLAASEATTARFIDDMQGDLQAQEKAVATVLDLADGMREALAAIDSLAHYSNILSLNARVEAARIGHHGAGFAVIADHTRELSKTIREAAERVNGAIESVREALPPVSARATSMQQRTRSFIGVVADQMKSASAQATSGEGQAGLEDVMRLSNEALSHLQFQDSLKQGLLAINGDVATMQSRVHRVLEGETALEALPMAAASQDHPTPGKITLF